MDARDGQNDCWGSAPGPRSSVTPGLPALNRTTRLCRSLRGQPAPQAFLWSSPLTALSHAHWQPALEGPHPPALGPPSQLGVCEATAAASERSDLIPPVHPKSPAPHTDQPSAGPGWCRAMLSVLRRTELLQVTALLWAW